jgi:hypothetical protein
VISTTLSNPPITPTLTSGTSCRRLGPGIGNVNVCFGSFAHRRTFESGRSVAILLTRRQKSAHGRVNRILIFSTISINGRLQSTPVSGQENRDRQVWVESASSLRFGQRLQSV